MNQGIEMQDVAASGTNRVLLCFYAGKQQAGSG